MSKKVVWHKGPYWWEEGEVRFVSIPFTWNLPEVRRQVQGILMDEKIVAGGPAVKLMPQYFADLERVEVGGDIPGVLQMVNPLATRTTTGCVRRCRFCGIGRGLIEPGGFRELDDWPDLPVVCDNNLLASSIEHFDRVVDRLVEWGWADFNQGLDARLLNRHHAERLAGIKKPQIRLACDTAREVDGWMEAVEVLLSAGVKKSHIGTYVLIGFDSGPDEAWDRCWKVHGTVPTLYPMWFHRLDSLSWCEVTDRQKEMGWSEKERIRLMRTFYQAKKGAFKGTGRYKGKGLLT